MPRATGHPVLLIDDDEGTLLTWRSMLMQEGFEVDQARSGAVGLALARQGQYDVVVLDLRLPDMTGIALLDVLRARSVDTPVLVVTGFATHESTAQAFRLGAADVLEKPIGEELIAAVRRLVQQRHANEAERVQDEGRPPRSLLELLAPFEQVATSPSREATDVATSEARDEATSDVVREAPAGEAFVAALVRALIRPDVHVRSFLPGAHALREAIAAHARQTLPPPRVAQIVKQFLRALEDHGPVPPPAIAEAVVRLDRAVRAGQNPIHESDVAKDLGLHPAHLGRLIKSHTGVGFRQLRRIFRARRALLLVASSNEQLAQIAYAVGYAHASQLDRDFRHLFGVQPGWIRRCLRVSSTIRK